MSSDERASAAQISVESTDEEITDEESSRDGSSNEESVIEEHISDEELSGFRSARHALDRGNRLYHEGTYDEALTLFQELVRGPGEEKLLANVGYALQGLGRHEEAARAFERYLQVFIARHHAWKALCFSYYHLEDYENMTRCAREAIRWDIRHDTPDDYSWQQMATAHFLMEDYSTAIKAARKASALNELNPYSRYYEACAITAIVEGGALDEPELLNDPPTYQDALELLRAALEARPELEDELRAEGYLDRVFELLDEQRALKLEQPESDLSDSDLSSDSDPSSKLETLETSGSEMNGSETKTSETKTSETKTAETKTAETKTSETKTSETKTSEIREIEAELNLSDRG